MPDIQTKPIIQMRDIEKHFGTVIALAGVSFDVRPGECHCLLGDNGAGKSTFIKTMSGVHKPSKGEIFFEGQSMNFNSPRDSLEAGIATVYQDLAMIPLMSVVRNFRWGVNRKKCTGFSRLLTFRWQITLPSKKCAKWALACVAQIRLLAHYPVANVKH